MPPSSDCSTHLQRSEVDHIVDVRVLLEHLVQLLLIGNVQFVVLGPLAADELDTVQDLLGRVVKVVDDDDLVVGLEKGESSERADVAGATMKRLMLELNNGFVELYATLSRVVALRYDPATTEGWSNDESHALTR
jgi:hypothetical protein